MARKFNNAPSNKKPQGGSYNSPPRNNRIQKDTKNQQPKSNQHHHPHKITQPANTVQNSQKFPPPPPLAPVQTKPLTEAGKSNLAKLASINKLMGNNIPAATIKTGTQTISQPNTKNIVKKPTAQQITQAIESLKDLEKLLDSYQDLQMDHNFNLKNLLQFMQQRNVDNQPQKVEKNQA